MERGSQARRGDRDVLSLDLDSGGVLWFGTNQRPDPTPGSTLPPPEAYEGGDGWRSPDAGLTWVKEDGFDLAFRVEVVPEPGATGLLALGAAVSLTRGKRFGMRATALV